LQILDALAVDQVRHGNNRAECHVGIVFKIALAHPGARFSGMNHQPPPIRSRPRTVLDRLVAARDEFRVRLAHG
jgi:hypothetical protein